MESIPRYFKPPTDHFFMLGPRGTGKTWLTQKLFPQVRPEDLRGLKNFGEDFPESRRWLLYRGRERLLRDGILCVPCEEFLLQLKPGELPA